jgi:predicted amidophosphoribosyltransferase
MRGDWLALPRSDQILLIDDVVTTGASVSTAARLLRGHVPPTDIVAAALAVRV